LPKKGTPKRKLVKLRSNQEFQAVFVEGRRIHGKGLHLLYRRDPTEGSRESARFGIAVGRKYGGAVWRNRIRRALRLEIRPFVSHFPKDFQIVMSVLVAAKEMPVTALRQEAKVLIEKSLKVIAKR